MRHHPLRISNKLLRPREHLYHDEVERVLEACSKMKNSLRNETMLLVSFNRGLRPAETLNLRWSHINFESNIMRVVRIKNGLSGDHVFGEREKYLLEELYKHHINMGYQSPHVFVTNNDQPIGIAAYGKMCKKVGELAGLPFKFHPHMCRHTSGEEARRRGMDVFEIKAHLGHVSIANTMRYTHNTGNSNIRAMFGT